MKKIFLVASLMATFGFVQAQNTKTTDKVNSQFSKPSKDYVMLQAGFNTLLLPNDTSIFLKNRGHALGAYICYDFPLKKSNFSFATGIGIGNSTIYLDSMVLDLSDTSVGARFQFDTRNLKRFKISANYLEAPFELRYFQNKENRNKGFKAALGVKVGMLVNLHTKAVLGTGLKEKETIRRYYDKYRYVATARVGWGNFSVFGNYQINNLLNPQSLQGVNPLSFGICLTGL
jgi:hypothetical protein